MENNQQINMQIARLRKEKGLTQEELANRLGVTFQAVSKWETGTSLPDVAMLPAIAACFETTVDEILGYNARPAGASGLYPVLRGALEGLPPDRLYRAVWNLSCLLHEAAETCGWSRAAHWPQRDRLGDNGYDRWGFSADIEPEGYTILTQGLTVIGLMEQLSMPSPAQCGRIAALFGRLSRANVLRVMGYVVGRQRGENDYKLFSAAELAPGAELGEGDCIAALGMLTDWGWLIEENGSYRLDNRWDLVLLPLLGILNAFCVDMKMR